MRRPRVSRPPVQVSSLRVTLTLASTRGCTAATGGRYPSCLGTIATAPLKATGAKSGQPREVELTYFHDGSDPILIASNYGGPKHPQWYHNLKAHPECEFGGERFLATQVTDPDEYARLYGLAEQIYAGYGDYRTKAVGRQIPVIRLVPR